MRNVFDQYTQPENQLTHALVTALAEDDGLLKGFIEWATGRKPPKGQSIKIVEQQLPGEQQPSEEDFERLGLPDAWIFDDSNWSILIESKISAPLKNDQLLRHFRTAGRRDFTEVSLLVIAIEEPRRELPDNTFFKSWSDVYRWLKKYSEKSTWALRVTEYMEIFEVKMTEKGYLKEGSLTEFTGIPFGENRPYSYLEARRVIKLAMAQLRNRENLIQRLGIDAQAKGRGQLTGAQEKSVWDFLRLSGSKSSEKHTHDPHFSLFIGETRVGCSLIIPNDISAKYRKNLVNLGFNGFCDLLSGISGEIIAGLKNADGAAPMMNALQRRWPSRGAAPFVDAYLEFDLRTAFSFGQKSPVKMQIQWLQATYGAVTNKESNIEIGVGTVFPYRACKLTQQVEILDAIENTWIACKPLVDTLVKGVYSGKG